MIDYQAARRKILSGKFSPAYLLFGEEDYLIESLISLLAKVYLGDSYVHGLEKIDGSAETLENSMDRLKGRTLFTARRILLVENPPYLAPPRRKKSSPKGDKSGNDSKAAQVESSAGGQTASSGEHGVKHLENHIEQAVTGQSFPSIVVFRCRAVDGRKRLYKLLDKKAEVVKCDRLKGNALKSWLAERVRQAGKRIDQDALELLLMSDREELHFYARELEKIITYLSKDETVISAPVVEKLLSGGSPGSVFKLVDFLAERNLPGAMQQLRLLLDRREEPLFIFFMIVRQFRLLIQVHGLLKEKGLSRGSLAAALKVKPFVARKLLQQYTVLNPERTALEDVMLLLQDTDYRIKTGRLDPVQALEVVIARINDLLSG